MTTTERDEQIKAARLALAGGRADLRLAEIGADSAAETVAGWDITRAIIRLNKLGVDTSKL